MAFQNPVIEHYKGKKIRKYNTIFIRVNQFEMKQFIDLKEDGFSERKIMEISGRPCEHCKGVEIVVMNKKKNKKISIKRGMLCKNSLTAPEK